MHKTVLEPIYIVGQGVAGRWWCTCIQGTGTFSVTNQCRELGKEWQLEKAVLTGAEHR